jgi:octaprenyl-diphosphate synthase
MPTINSLFSHQVSVIMGDYLYSRAVIELVRLDDLEPLRVLSRVTNEMTVGEMRQLLAHDPKSPKATTFIRRNGLPCRGRASVGAPEVSGDTSRHGTVWQRSGMAFRSSMTLDVTEAEVTGSDGLDLREHKVTLPLIYSPPPQRR